MGRTARGGRMSQVWFGLSCGNRTVWAVVPYWFTSVQWTHYHAYWFFSETWWEIYLTITRRWSRMGRWRTGRIVTSIHGMDVTKGDRPFWPRDGHVSVWRTLEGQGDNPGEVHVRQVREAVDDLFTPTIIASLAQCDQWETMATCLPRH